MSRDSFSDPYFSQKFLYCSQPIAIKIHGRAAYAFSNDVKSSIVNSGFLSKLLLAIIHHYLPNLVGTISTKAEAASLLKVYESIILPGKAL